MPAHEQEEFEARYFADDALFEHLLAIEDELIDRYTRGDITGAEAERLERHFLKSPARRTRLRFAEAWSRHANALSAGARRRRLSWWSWLKALLRARGPR